MKTFYLGLSMAGTVSAGTYTAGSLIELNQWLESWQKAKEKGVRLKAVAKTDRYNIGDTITFDKGEVPDHSVKIKAMTGASGGGVSAALYLAGLTTGKAEQLLREVWTNLDVREMLKTDDLIEGKSIFSVLNTSPIDAMMDMFRDLEWGETDYAASLEYLDDNMDLFMTLGSLEGIPFKTAAASSGQSLSYGIHKTHLDYIRFNFQKNKATDPVELIPYAYNLRFREGERIGSDMNWLKLIESAPATAAFPIGFKPRAVRRFRKEYEGKLFYMDYVFGTSNKSGSRYRDMQPNWKPGNRDDSFDMEYVDGGTFNREPHDLARASLINSLDLGSSVPNDGISTKASVILIDPFPTNFDEETLPGNEVKGVPSLFELAEPLLGAMLNQGRFRPDWIERTLKEDYYSRFLISPIRRNTSGEKVQPALAGGILGAFSGFLHRSYREHDYSLGRYNSYQFLKKHFAVPTENVVVDYYAKASDDLKEKMEAVGWYLPKGAEENHAHCQIIPRTLEPDQENSLNQPQWPNISRDEWEEIYSLGYGRAKRLADVATKFKLDRITDAAIWQFFAKEKILNTLKNIEDTLIDARLLRK